MTASVDGVGTVLVDSNGDALYSPSQEANGMIQCTGSCAQIWKPLTAAGAPTGSADVTGKLGTVKRPDGTEQVTLDGAPLYTFTEDSPGQVNGDGFQDSFGGKDFTWHVLTVGGAPQQGQSTTARLTGGRLRLLRPPQPRPVGENPAIGGVFGFLEAVTGGR